MSAVRWLRCFYDQWLLLIGVAVLIVPIGAAAVRMLSALAGDAWDVILRRLKKLVLIYGARKKHDLSMDAASHWRQGHFWKYGCRFEGSWGWPTEGGPRNVEKSKNKHLKTNTKTNKGLTYLRRFAYAAALFYEFSVICWLHVDFWLFFRNHLLCFEVSNGCWLNTKLKTQNSDAKLKYWGSIGFCILIACEAETLKNKWCLYFASIPSWNTEKPVCYVW